MGPNKFWNIVESVRQKDGDEAHAGRLEKALKLLREDEIIAFSQRFSECEVKLDQSKILAAAELILGRPCSDDGFLYFRRWLISRGRDFYAAALRNVDLLADKTTRVTRRQAQFESYWYAIATAYESTSGKDFYRAHKPVVAKPSIRDMQHNPLSGLSDVKLAASLPKLWKKYGRDVVAFRKEMQVQMDTLQSAVVDVKGVGKIKAGTTIQHKHFGVGVVMLVVPYGTPSALVKFSDGENPVQLSVDTVSIIK